MSALADDGAARLDQVMRKHRIGASGTVARNSSIERKRLSREVDAEPATLPSEDQAGDGQKSSEQVHCKPSFEDLDSTGLEAALKEKAYRLAGAWEHGAQKLSAHLQDALAELQSVKEQENALLQRRLDLCCGELDDQIAEMERSFQQKAQACKQQMLARIADQRASCELAIRAKAESLLGMLEDVDGVPCASRDHPQAGAQQSNSMVHRLAQHPDDSLAHGPCHCCTQDERVRHADAQAAELYPAHRPVHRQLDYQSLSPTIPRDTFLSAHRLHRRDFGLGKAATEWWKPSPRTTSPGSKGTLDLAAANQEISPAFERMATLGVTFRRYKPCNCRARSGMVAPRAPLRLAHLLDQSDEE